MKHLKSKWFLPILIICTIASFVWLAAVPPAQAATPMSGAQRAQASSAGVTAGTFVKLSAANIVATATAVTDKVVGIAEITADANAGTRYAPMGTQAIVTSGEAITVGDLLTAGTGGKAFVLDTDDASTQRYAAMALTAASDANESVTVILQAGVVEKRLAKAGSTTVAGDVLPIPITAGVVVKTTAGDGEALSLADGTAGQILVITLGTDGGGDGTLTPTTATGWATIVFADAGDTAALMYIDDTVGWVILGLSGVAAPPAMTAS